MSHGAMQQIVNFCGLCVPCLFLFLLSLTLFFAVDGGGRVSSTL